MPQFLNWIFFCWSTRQLIAQQHLKMEVFVNAGFNYSMILLSSMMMSFFLSRGWIVDYQPSDN